MVLVYNIIIKHDSIWDADLFVVLYKVFEGEVLLKLSQSYYGKAIYF